VLGQPIVALDYSEACLRLMLRRTAGSPVLAVQADLRTLPLRSTTMAAATCIEVYSQFQRKDRDRLLAQFARVLEPDAPLSISAFNHTPMFRAWKLLGNSGAHEGEHMLRGDCYYLRFSRDEFRTELEGCLDIDELTGIRNTPARSLAEGLRRVGLREAGDRLLDFMVRRGHRADFVLERTPLAGALGSFWLAEVRAPTAARS